MAILGNKDLSKVLGKDNLN